MTVTLTIKKVFVALVRGTAAPCKVTEPSTATTPAATKRRATPEGRLSLTEVWERSRRIMAGASPAPCGESADIVRRDRDARETRRPD